MNYVTPHLIGGAFDHVTAERPDFLASLEGIHARLVVAEESKFTGKGLEMRGALVRGMIQFVGESYCFRQHKTSAAR